MKTLPGFPLVEGNHVTFTARLLMFVVVKFGATGAESTTCETGVKNKQLESQAFKCPFTPCDCDCDSFYRNDWVVQEGSIDPMRL